MKNKIIFTCFLVCEGLSNDDVGEPRSTVFQEKRPAAGFKTGDFVKEMLGGATVERRRTACPSPTTGFEFTDSPTRWPNPGPVNRHVPEIHHREPRFFGLMSQEPRDSGTKAPTKK